MFSHLTFVKKKNSACPFAEIVRSLKVRAFFLLTVCSSFVLCVCILLLLWLSSDFSESSAATAELMIELEKILSQEATFDGVELAIKHFYNSFQEEGKYLFIALIKV